MQPDEPALFLSLRPRFAELFLNGHKSIELRRKRPSVSKGTMVLLYASSPTMTLVGRAEVAAVHAGDIEEIWCQYGPETGVSRGEYESYFEGLDQAVAIKLINVRPLKRPRPLEELRNQLSGFQPPQSYRYLSSSQVAALV